MKKSIFSLIKIALLVILVVTIAIIFNYVFQRTFIWDRYWERTVKKSNERSALTTKNFIELYGSEKFSSLGSAQITKDYSNLGYNFNILVIRNSQIVSHSQYYPISKSIDEQKIYYTIDCAAPNTNENCSIVLLEDVNAKARNLYINYIDWLKNWFSVPKDNFGDKYNNITYPFLVALASSSLIAMIGLGWYFYADKKKRILREKEEENRRQEEEIEILKRLLDGAQEKAKKDLDEYGEMAEGERTPLVAEIEELKKRQAQGLSVEEYNKIKEDYERLEKRLRESKTSKEIKKVFSGIFENLEFSDAFIKKEDIKPGDSVSRKICEYLSYFNKGDSNPFPNTRKNWNEKKKSFGYISDRENLPMLEYDTGSKARLFVQFPKGEKYIEIRSGKQFVITSDHKPYIANIDYEHKFSEGK